MAIESDTQLAERNLAAALLSDSAARASAALDRFASWLLAGFGAGVALLLTHRDAAIAIPASTIGYCVSAFGSSTVLVVVEKYLSLIAIGGGQANKSTREITTQIIAGAIDAGKPFDFQVVVREITRAVFWPVRIFVSRAADKALSGDLTYFPRKLMQLGQVQGLLVIAQVVIFLLSIWRIAATLRAAS